jgi:hypothetical protein
MSAAQRSAVIVLGVHGSGAKDLAHVVNLLSGISPRNVTLAADATPDHGVSHSIAALNERLLASADGGSNHGTHMAWEQPVDSSALAEARKALRNDYSHAPLFVLNDPRMDRMVSFGLKAIKGLDVRPVIAFSISSPYDTLNAGDGADRGPLAWLCYVLETEAATRHWPRDFFTHEQLLVTWKAMIGRFETRTDLHFSPPSVSIDAKITTFLAKEASHKQKNRSQRILRPHG